ncbi:MAG: type II toxin-antitoxin system RelE/ParE family toxin [Hymenobacter sp.]
MADEFIRNVVYYRRYYLDFFATLKPAVQKKFNRTLKLLATVDRVPATYFKHLTGSSGLYEIRVEVGSDIYRVFSFFDKDQLVILVNGF